MRLKSSRQAARWIIRGQATYPSRWSGQLRRRARKWYSHMSRRSQWWVHLRQRENRKLPSRSTSYNKPPLPGWRIICPSPNRWPYTNHQCRKDVAHKLLSRRGSNRCIAICSSGAYMMKDKTSLTRWLFNHLFKVLRRRTNSWETACERTWNLDLT